MDNFPFIKTFYARIQMHSHLWFLLSFLFLTIFAILNKKPAVFPDKKVSLSFTFGVAPCLSMTASPKYHHANANFQFLPPRWLSLSTAYTSWQNLHSLASLAMPQSWLGARGGKGQVVSRSYQRKNEESSDLLLKKATITEFTFFVVQLGVLRLPEDRRWPLEIKREGRPEFCPELSGRCKIFFDVWDDFKFCQ